MPNNEAGFEILADNTTEAVRMATDCVEGTSATGAHGMGNFVFRDNSGNLTRPSLDASGNIKVSATQSGTDKVTERLGLGGTQGVITVGTTAIEMKVGVSAVANRALITITPNASGYFYGPNNSVTATNGIPLTVNVPEHIKITSTGTVFVIKQSGSATVRLTEWVQE